MSDDLVRDMAIASGNGEEYDRHKALCDHIDAWERGEDVESPWQADQPATLADLATMEMMAKRVSRELRHTRSENRRLKALLRKYEEVVE